MASLRKDISKLSTELADLRNIPERKHQTLDYAADTLTVFLDVLSADAEGRRNSEPYGGNEDLVEITRGQDYPALIGWYLDASAQFLRIARQSMSRSRTATGKYRQYIWIRASLAQSSSFLSSADFYLTRIDGGANAH